jgi:predicted ATP-grasp superfamily ATP-dependent carboligase
VRLLVFEYFSHLHPRHAHPGLRRAGAALRRAMEDDLRQLPDARLVPAPARGKGSPATALRAFRHGLREADAALFIAPEERRILERFAAACDAAAVLSLGPGPEAVRLAADKRRTGDLLAAAGVPVPRRLASVALPPFVVKPRRGCGARGVTMVRRRGPRGTALGRARAAAGGDGILLEELVPGVPLSAAFLVRAGARTAQPGDILCLGIATQRLHTRRSGAIDYRGGTAPWDAPASAQVASIARLALAALLEAVPDVRGYVGVDLVLGPRGAVVIEINPRPTSSYLGWRRVHGAGLARLTIAAAAGEALPDGLEPKGRVAFDAEGMVHTIPHAGRSVA